MRYINYTGALAAFRENVLTCECFDVCECEYEYPCPGCDQPINTVGEEMSSLESLGSGGRCQNCITFGDGNTSDPNYEAERMVEADRHMAEQEREAYRMAESEADGRELAAMYTDEGEELF